MREPYDLSGKITTYKTVLITLVCDKKNVMYCVCLNI